MTTLDIQQPKQSKTRNGKLFRQNEEKTKRGTRAKNFGFDNIDDFENYIKNEINKNGLNKIYSSYEFISTYLEDNCFAVNQRNITVCENRAQNAFLHYETNQRKDNQIINLEKKLNDKNNEISKINKEYSELKKELTEEVDERSKEILKNNRLVEENKKKDRTIKKLKLKNKN